MSLNVRYAIELAFVHWWEEVPKDGFQNKVDLEHEYTRFGFRPLIEDACNPA